MRRIIKLAIPVLFLLTVAAAILVACNRTSEKPETPAAKSFDSWEYNVLNCEVDRGNNDLVCSTNDGFSMLNYVLVNYGQKGWELTAIYDPGENSSRRTLVFKRQP